MNQLLSWLDDRTGIVTAVQRFTQWQMPSTLTWRYLWGWLAIINFAILLITGLFLSSTYSPSSQTAWESTFYIQHMMTGGWLLRGLHHFASQSMVVILALFFLQLVIDGAYRAPREVTYWSTLVLMLLTLGLAHTGYLLPWDQRGYAAADVFTNIVGSVPIIGEYAQQVIQGGSLKGHQTLTRLHLIHVAVIPLLISIVFMLHLYLLSRQSQKHPAIVLEKTQKRVSFWPDQLLRIGLASFVLSMGLLGVVIYFHGADLASAADPSEPYSAARPEWYFLFLFRFLRTPIVEKLGLAFGAIHVPGLITTIILLFPFIAVKKAGYYFNLIFSIALFVGIIGLTAMTLQEDRVNSDHQAAVHQAEIQAARATELALSPTGIPVEGGVYLLRNDPLTQGPKIYASRCATCHPWDGHDGLGHPLERSGIAPDLANFGSREWMKGVLVDFETVFASTVNAQKDGKKIGTAFTEGEMANWSKDHRELLNEPENADDLSALIEFFYAQSRRPDALALDHELVVRGRDIMDFGELTKGEFELTCIDCHQIKPLSEEKTLGSLGTAPHLTEYASPKWLKAFISDPDSQEHYGSTTNAMPSFESQLSPHELEMLVRWMTKDYYRSPKD